MSNPADCPNCGKPTASDDSATAYADRHDPSFCSPITSPNCWDWENAEITNESTGETWIASRDLDPAS